MYDSTSIFDALNLEILIFIPLECYKGSRITKAKCVTFYYTIIQTTVIIT